MSGALVVPDVCLSSPPVMAWRHPDVCNRHQKSQAREDLRVYFGKTQVSFSVSYGKSLRSLLRKLDVPFSITKSIPAPPTPLDPAGKSKYLESLRACVAAAQDQINKELTTRMEEDKAREGAAAVDEEKEEENYGEEVQEEED
ncbi:hypothetical protein GGI43DRAFT_388436 [Trichoderma evansii]